MLYQSWFWYHLYVGLEFELCPHSNHLHTKFAVINAPLSNKCPPQKIQFFNQNIEKTAFSMLSYLIVRSLTHLEIPDIDIANPEVK